ncbi:Hypothetical predicted protein, partial [Paramuricea clavata]
MAFDFYNVQLTKPRHRWPKGLIARSRRKCGNTLPAANNTLKHVDILQKLVKSYNHSRHRSISMRPVDVNKNNENIVWQTHYGKESKKSVQLKFNIGDQVRISKAKRTFKKGYLPNWTEEVFTVTKHIPRRPLVYKIADYDGEELEGTFYEQELQKFNKSGNDDLIDSTTLPSTTQCEPNTSELNLSPEDVLVCLRTLDVNKAT